MARYNVELANLSMVISMGKPKGLKAKRIMIKYEPLASFEYNKQRDRDKKAWQKVSDNLPDNAFADDAVPDEAETYGKVSKKIMHIETGIDHYDG